VKPGFFQNFFCDSGISANFFFCFENILKFFFAKTFLKIFPDKVAGVWVALANSILIHLEYLPSQGVEECQTTLEYGLTTGRSRVPERYPIPGSIWAPIAFFRIQTLISHRTRFSIFKKYRLKRFIWKTERFKPNKICEKSRASTGSVILA